MTAIAAEEAKVVVHLLLLLLLGELAILPSLEERLDLLLLEEMVGGHLELFEDELELLLLLEPKLFFLLSDWLLGFVDLSDLSALLELAAFSRLILEWCSQ